MKYLINGTAIIFLDIDRVSHFHTIAYDWETDSVLAIRPKEYHLLKYLFDQSGATDEELFNYLGRMSMESEEMQLMIKNLISKNLIFISND